VTRGQLPQRAGSLGLNGGGAAAAVLPLTAKDLPAVPHCKQTFLASYYYKVSKSGHLYLGGERVDS